MVLIHQISLQIILTRIVFCYHRLQATMGGTGWNGMGFGDTNRELQMIAKTIKVAHLFYSMIIDDKLRIIVQ